MDVLLVGPSGQPVVLMSDAGSGSANNVTLTISEAAAAALPASGLVSGTFRPTNLSDSSPGGDNFPSPAPAGPYGASLSVFNGQTPNGTWSLYCFDDGPGDLGSFAGGWSLTLTMASGTASFSPAVVGIGSGQNPPRISLAVNPQHEISLTVSGDLGSTYALEISTDLVNWTRVATRENTSGSIVFQDASSTDATRFYRAVRVGD
jgi:hypothetical protein